MYRAFDEVCIHKPNTSRPANSERYIICKGKRPNVEAIRDYMFKINSRLNQLGFSQLGVTKSNVDVNEIVPLSLIFEDKEFAEYMRKSNDIIGERQIVSLIKIRAFHQDQNLFETRQRQIRDECLKIWNVPDQVRKAPGFEDPQHRVQDMLRPEPEVQILESAGTSLDPINLNTAVKSVFDWKCILMGSVRSEDCTFYLGMGRNKNYSYNKIQHRWQAVPHSFRFDLPAQTLIYAESVQENRGEGKGMRKCPALHIIDAVYIAGEDWRVKYDLKERNRLLRLFVKAMAKPSQPDHVIMRVKDIVGLENLQDQCLALLKLRTLKGFNGLKLTVDLETEIVNGREFSRYMMPTGILMLPIVNEPYMMAFSRSQGRKYWFNYTNRESVFECPPLAGVDFKTSFQKRLLWNWDEGVQLYPNQEVSRSDKKLHWDILNDFCRQKMGK
jgi:cap1 methyltransferase